MRVLLTGASGFVGSHVLRHLLANTDWDITCPVTFRHKGLPSRIASSVCDYPEWIERVQILHGVDLRAGIDPVTAAMIGDVDVIMNVASESHVDRSIETPAHFIRSNVELMTGVLDYARTVRPKLVLQMSTDEVYGPAYGDHLHREWEPIRPSNPYSASKAAQEAIAFSYWRTYGLPIVVTNTMNIIGEMQDPEKFVPMIIQRLADPDPASKVTVHCAADGTPGSRFYLHARNLADAWTWLARRYVSNPEGERLHVPQYEDGWMEPDRWHIVGEREVDNIELTHLVGRFLGLSEAQVDAKIERVDFHGARPGHDRRYALSGERLAEAGWTPPIPLDASLKKTVEWTLARPEWLRA